MTFDGTLLILCFPPHPSRMWSMAETDTDTVQSLSYERRVAPVNDNRSYLAARQAGRQEDEEEEEEEEEEDEDEDEEEEEDEDEDEEEENKETTDDEETDSLDDEEESLTDELAKLQKKLSKVKQLRAKRHRRKHGTALSSSRSSMTTATDIQVDQETASVDMDSEALVTQQPAGIVSTAVSAVGEFLFGHAEVVSDGDDPYDNPTPGPSADATPPRESQPPAKKKRVAPKRAAAKAAKKVVVVPKAKKGGPTRKLRSRKNAAALPQVPRPQQIPESIEQLQEEMTALKTKFGSGENRLSPNERERLAFLVQFFCPPETRTAADMGGYGRGGSRWKKGPKQTKAPPGHQPKPKRQPQPLQGARSEMASQSQNFSYPPRWSNRPGKRSRGNQSVGYGPAPPNPAPGPAPAPAAPEDTYNPRGFPNPTQDGADYCYIKNIELQINGASPDMFQGGVYSYLSATRLIHWGGKGGQKEDSKFKIGEGGGEVNKDSKMRICCFFFFRWGPILCC
jgi:ElaB/YqjD/DUF883 family membrane-anchored ribosome-binding protein